MTTKQKLQSVGLSLVCILIGYGFYSMNHRDWINAIFFTIGLLGIMLSVVRRKKTVVTTTEETDRR